MSTEVGLVDNAAVVVCDVGEQMRVAWLVRESLSSASDGRCFTVRVDVKPVPPLGQRQEVKS